jgi:hypothetical protein
MMRFKITTGQETTAARGAVRSRNVTILKTAMPAAARQFAGLTPIPMTGRIFEPLGHKLTSSHFSSG